MERFHCNLVLLRTTLLPEFEIETYPQNVTLEVLNFFFLLFLDLLITVWNDFKSAKL